MGVTRYGREWPEGVDALNIELYCFRHDRTVEQGGLGKAGHFRNIVNVLWHPTSPKPWTWHPWADQMLEGACRTNYLAVAGCASSGKTDFFAVWAIVNYIAAPLETMVLVTSTTLKESRKRIWGSIREYWQAVPGLPGKLVDSVGQIRFEDGSGESLSDKAGITLVAAERSKEKQAIGKLIGLKQKRVFLIADELPELSEAILQAAYSNLSANPYFQLVGLGNPNSYYDAFGLLAQPKGGWATVTVNDEEWQTERGVCIHLDGTKSPNILAGRTIYPWMITEDKLEDARQKFGEKSVAYWRMFRGFWCPSGSEDSIYAEADIVKTQADAPPLWLSPPTPNAALDPSFTNGGDRSILYFGYVGTDANTKVRIVCFDRFEPLSEDVSSKEPRAYQIVRQFRARCEQEGVSPRNAAYDATGAGNPFGDIVDALWSRDVLRVQFGGKASKLPVSLTDRTLSDERYANRVTELWFSAKELMRTGQVRGICKELAREMCERRYITDKSGTLRLRVEPKSEMKERTGKSPDVADAAFILLDLARQRHGMAADPVGYGSDFGGRQAAKRKIMDKFNQVATSRSVNLSTGKDLRLTF